MGIQSPASMVKKPIGTGSSAPTYGALGSGSTTSINPHGMNTQMLNWLSGYQAMMQGQPQPSPATTGSNMGDMAMLGARGLGKLSRERLGGMNVRRDYRMTGQRIDNAQEDLRKKRILMDENLASRGVMGKTREGRSDTNWRTETAQNKINLARVENYENKKRWKRGRLHRLLFN